MRVIPPILINDSKLASSSVPEDDYAEWAVGTTYGLGARVILTSTHKIYESVSASNTGNNPAAEATDPPTYWLEIGFTNRWRMFDTLRNTRTVATDELVVEILPGERIDSVALVGLEGQTALIQVYDGTNLVYEQELFLKTRVTSTWYEYFFEKFDTLGAVSVFDVPPFTNARVKVTISGYGEVSCGALVVGKSSYIGQTEIQAVSDALNFSVVERNEFGDSFLQQRRSIPKTNQTVLAEKRDVDKLLALRTQLNAQPAVWSGLDDATDGYFNALLILGYYRQFLISLEYPNHALVQLELEEI